MSLYIVRKKLSADEVSPPNIRYVPETDSYQQTFDGGATWVDAPALDPRSAPGYRMPALTTDDPRCDAAANMVVALRQMVTVLATSANRVQLLTFMFGIFFAFVPFGWIADVILAVVDGLIIVGITPFVDAMTEDVYDQFLCIFYCNIDETGQMSDGQLHDIYVAVEAQLGTTISGGFGTLSGGFGANGWSNAGAMGSETGDCDDCTDCAWCVEIDFTLTDGGFALLGGATPDPDGSTWTPGVGWVGGCWDAAGALNAVRIGQNLGAGFAITHYDLTYSVVVGSGDLTDHTFVDTDDTTDGETITTSVTGDDQHLLWDGTATLQIPKIVIWSSNGDCSGSCVATKMRFEGHGTKPEFDGWEDC